MVIAELIDGCKLKCALCWNRNRIPSMKQMPLETIELVLEKYGASHKIDWFNWGDPLLHKEFIVIAEMIKNSISKISSSFSHHMTPEHFDALNNFKTVIVSISGMTEDIYKIYHRGGNFKLVWKNLETLIENKKNRIVLRWLSHKDNSNQILWCSTFCEENGIEFEPITLNCEVEELFENFDHKLLKEQRNKTKHKSCKLLKWIPIGVDGSYYLCCASHNIKTGYSIHDDISTTKLTEIKSEIPLCKACQQFEFWKMFC